MNVYIKTYQTRDRQEVYDLFFAGENPTLLKSEEQKLCEGKLTIIINNYQDGGLKMIDIESFNKSLKTTWIKRYLGQNNQGKWKVFFELKLQPSGCDKFFQYNRNKEDFNKYFKISDGFFFT